MKDGFKLDSEQARKKAHYLIDKTSYDDQVHEFIIKPYRKDRSLAQNRLQQLWNKEIHEQRHKILEMPVSTKSEIRAFNKVRFGVPIMMEDPEFESAWRVSTGHLNYRAIMKVVENLDIPVTRLMKVGQFTRHLNDMLQFWSERGAELSQPEDLYNEAMGRKKWAAK